MSYFVRAVGFHPDGVTFDYVSPEEDVRDNGMALNHILFVPHSEDFAELLDTLVDAIDTAMNGAMAALRQTPPVDLSDDDDDAAPSPYDNPLERDVPTPVDTAQEGDRP